MSQAVQTKDDSYQLLFVCISDDLWQHVNCRCHDTRLLNAHQQVKNHWCINPPCIIAEKQDQYTFTEAMTYS
jgi:hypothetical protein